MACLACGNFIQTAGKAFVVFLLSVTGELLSVYRSVQTCKWSCLSQSYRYSWVQRSLARTEELFLFQHSSKITI